QISNQLTAAYSPAQRFPSGLRAIASLVAGGRILHSAPPFLCASPVAVLPSIEIRLANELAIKPAQVTATVALIDDGATVPFIARYRKEATGGLDDAQLR